MFVLNISEYRFILLNQAFGLRVLWGYDVMITFNNFLVSSSLLVILYSNETIKDVILSI